METMLRIFTDFNAMTADDVCWLLKYRDKPLADQIRELRLGIGSKIVLYQDQDFEVEAVLDSRYINVLKRKTLVAIPDWSTIRYS